MILLILPRKDKPAIRNSDIEKPEITGHDTSDIERLTPEPKVGYSYQ